jgi:hypothetical protein
MKIAIIGSGNVGGALAQQFIKAGHTVLVGVQFPLSEKSIGLAGVIGEDRFNTPEGAVAQCDVIVLATPSTAAAEVAKSLGDTTGKVIIDTMNVVMGRGPAGFTNTGEAVLANTQTRDVVKCFNTTGFENMLNPAGIDMYMAGDSLHGKQIAEQLALEIGFGRVFDFGGNDKFSLIEQFAGCWINLAIFQKYGRNIALRVVTTLA